MSNITVSNSTQKGCKLKEHEDGDSFAANSWVIAVVLAIFAALINNLGVNLQKLAWTKKSLGVMTPRKYGMIWGVGMVGIVMASVLDFVALAFGPQSVIAPLGSLTMVANAFVAPYMHGEKLNNQVIRSTALIIVGCVLSVAMANHHNSLCDISSLFGLYLTTRFAIYAAVLGSWFIGMNLFIRRTEKIVAEFGADSPEYMRVYTYHRVSYAALSGMYGSQSVLFARSIDQLLVSNLTSEGRIFLAYPGTYAILGALIGCIFLQIYWLNQGLKRFESLYNVPIFTSMFILGTVLGGGVFYQEFEGFSILQWIFFPLGIGLCILGVFFLSQGGVPEDRRVTPAGTGDMEENDRSSGDLDAVSPSARVLSSSGSSATLRMANVGTKFADEDDDDLEFSKSNKRVQSAALAASSPVVPDFFEDEDDDDLTVKGRPAVPQS